MFDDNNGWDGMDGGGRTRREKETHKIGKTKYLQGGWNKWCYCGWSINLALLLRKTLWRPIYKVIVIDWLCLFFYKLDEYLFLARNRQSSTWFIFSPFLYVQVLSLLVSTLWGPGRGSLLLLIQVRELCVVVVSFLVVWCLGWCEVSIQIGNIFIYNNSILELLRIFFA